MLSRSDSPHLDLSRVCILPPALAAERPVVVRAVHFARVLVLPARERLPERSYPRIGATSCRSPSTSHIGTVSDGRIVFAASRYGSPGSIWPPLWRWILYAGDRRGWRQPDLSARIAMMSDTLSKRRNAKVAPPRRSASRRPKGGRFPSRSAPAAAPPRSFSSALTMTIRQRSAEGENGGRTLEEANIVRSFRSVGQWSGAPLQINERFPEGQGVAVCTRSARWPDHWSFPAVGRLDLIA